MEECVLKSIAIHVHVLNKIAGRKQHPSENTKWYTGKLTKTKKITTHN